MEVFPDGSVRCVSTRRRGVHLPSVDSLFLSAAAAWKERGVGILLTGMGADGAEGLLEMKRAGAATVAQDEGSCAVYGMPAEAVRLGAASLLLPPREIGEFLVRAAGKARGGREATRG
jgi:two-component system chemotaxis response regulator CheB